MYLYQATYDHSSENDISRYYFMYFVKSLKTFKIANIAAKTRNTDFEQLFSTNYMIYLYDCLLASRPSHKISIK